MDIKFCVESCIFVDFWTDFDSNIMSKRKKSIVTGDKSKVAQKGNDTMQSSQPLQMDDSWSSVGLTLEEGSKSGDM